MRTHSFSFWKLTLTAWAIKSALFHKPCANLSKQRQTFSAVQHLDHDIYHDTCQSRAKSLKSRHPRHPRHPSILAWDVSKAGSFTVEAPPNLTLSHLSSKVSGIYQEGIIRTSSEPFNTWTCGAMMSDAQWIWMQAQHILFNSTPWL